MRKAINNIKFGLTVFFLLAISAVVSGNTFAGIVNSGFATNVCFTFQQESLIAGHYVVIGAFRDYKNADKLLRRVRSVGLNPKSFKNNSRNMYYIYMFIDDNYDEANRVSRKLREVNFIKDAWVFSAESNVPLSETLLASADSTNINLLTDVDESEPVRNQSKNNSSERNYRIPKEFMEDESSTPIVSRENNNLKTTAGKETISSNQQEETIKPTLRESDNRDKKTSSTTSRVKDNNTKTERKHYDYSKSASMTKLVNAKKGETIIFESLLFHKSSSILRKNSKDEMERLYYLLNSQPNMKIKIHGHTNGEFDGEMYLLAETDQRFFKLSGKNEVVKGDEKKLSRERAQVIKKYLVFKGIASDRIETMGWGDNKMIYPKDHLKSSQNRRVEIEVLDN